MRSPPRGTMPASAALAAFILAAACSANRADRFQDTATGAVAMRGTASMQGTDDLDDRVEHALEADSTLGLFRLDADDDDGKIVLEGAVRTDEQKRLAQQIASTVAPGVTVENRIHVSDDAPMRKTRDLDDLGDKVEDALEADSVLAAFDLDADVENGTIVVEGTVSTDDQKARAEKIARQVTPGVTIVNRVRVK